MAQVLIEPLLVRCPFGIMSGTLQYLVGLDRLGHGVVFIECANHCSARDLVTGISGLDCSPGGGWPPEAVQARSPRTRSVAAPSPS
jgi:hypothetical protein